MEKYIHRVQYYETDKMGITHHSNYIRWMEEARVDFFEKKGMSYSKLEEIGIISPVIEINCKYKSVTKFEDEIEILTRIKEFKGVKLVFEYVMKDKKNGEINFVGESKHCFINKEGKPIILKKEFPDIDKKLKDMVEN